MPVPSTQEIRRALLEILRGGNPQYITAKKLMTLTEKHLGITASIQPQDIKQFKDRITEALQYLTEQNMISNPSRYTYMITKNGKNALENVTDTPDENFDTLPDAMDLTSDDADTVDIAETQDIAEDIDTAEIPDENLDTLPETIDLTSDDTDIVTDTVYAAETQDVAETPDIAEETPDFAETPNVAEETQDTAEETQDTAEETQDTAEDIDVSETQDFAENSLDSDTDTLNSIDEVDHNMPKDDFPADDFSTADDFSSAVSQALNIEDVFERHNSELADKVLMRAAGLSPEMFAVFVTDLLSKMGYNAFQTARYTPESGGSSMIQGVILDPKAKNPIYIHADKLSPGRTVGRSDMHDFADELTEKGGTGIFATTGEFSEQAGIYAQDERIMLIDGKKLASLMLANNFCVNVAKVFEVKELDEESFSEYE